MFAAGRKAVAQSVDTNAEGNDNDWLSVGKSFSGGKNDDNAKTKQNAESALQVYKHRHGKPRHKEKKRHKERKRHSEESTAVTSRHKTSKDKKRRRSWSRSDSSDNDGETRRSNHRSRRRRHRSHSNSRSQSRSRSRSHKEETRIVKLLPKDVVVQGQQAGEEQEKLFEFDCVGDRENQFFGSTYVHDQPLYELATRRNLLNGKWVSQTRPKITSSRMYGKQAEDKDSLRYFSQQARKMERDARQKRLYIAYSEKRLARAAGKDEMDRSDQNTSTVVSHTPEMAFIPLAPVLDVNNTDEERGHTPEERDNANGVLLTDGQSVEQHVVERSKLLNAAIAASPHEIDNWLDLVAFQEQTMRLHTKTKKLSAAMKASVVEKQAAILSRALANNPQSRELHRVKLNMSLQSQMSGESADADSLQRELENLLSEDLTNSELWFKLLQIRHQHFGSFSMQSVRDLYARILTVLRGDSAATASPSSASNPTGQTKARVLGIQKEELLILQLDFHFIMCLFEIKAGYVERAITQLQALLDFSLNESDMTARTDSKETHLELLRKFASRWNDENAVGFGDETSGSDSGILEEDPPKLSAAEFQDYIQRSSVATLDQVNPPEVLRTEEHKQSLLSASAVFQRRSRIKDEVKVADSSNGGVNEIDLTSGNYTASDESGAESKQDGKLIYSNLHGYRISVDEADDAMEYERILTELRGTENARARQNQLLEKKKMKRAVLATTKSQVEDQRANYPSIDRDDHVVRWLMREEVQTQLQWMPLRSNNPLHQDLIEQQPDRTTLTEEIQPFLFTVPVTHQWRLVAELLQICGVEWRGEFSWRTSFSGFESMYADRPADYELLAAPILSALSCQADHQGKSTLLFNPCDRKSLLENYLLSDVAVKEGVLRDPNKVAFVRRVFKQALDAFHNDEDFGSTLKCLWVGFEAEVSRVAGGQEESLVYARGLSQKLAQKTVNGDTDFDILYAYAKLELVLGNERQVRRICENTLKSLTIHSPNSALLARNFHRFVFLRARQEMWPNTGDEKKTRDQGRLRLLRCLYILWNCWHPEQLDGKEKETLDVVSKRHEKRTYAYLQELLMSDSSTGTNLIAEYREELDFSIRCCVESTSRNPEHINTRSRSHCRSKCWAGYCLHNLALVVYAYHGFEAACNEYHQALANVEHRACSQLLWMWACFLEFMQQHQVSGFFPAVAPRLWRSSVGEAVENFPNNELFLRLFVDSETGNTISQVLRKYFFRIEKRRRRYYDSPELVEWLFALLCEFTRVERAATIKELSEVAQVSNGKPSRLTCCLFHRWGMNTTAVTRLRQMFESMVNQIRTKGNALCWRLYMRFEVALGKVDSAKKLLYRGIAACAWSKELYMDGLRVMRAYLSEEECQELLEFMEAKELNVRVDFEE